MNSVERYKCPVCGEDYSERNDANECCYLGPYYRCEVCRAIHPDQDAGDACCAPDPAQQALPL